MVPRWAPLPRRAASTAVPLGDDCAVLPDTTAICCSPIEGFVEDFVDAMPWFAGYCGVMVNVSDIAAMGGRPLAVVDALWSRGRPARRGAGRHGRGFAALRRAARRRPQQLSSERAQLAVAILGRARRLMTSFDARPGDRLLMAVDLRGVGTTPPYWNARHRRAAERLRDDLALLPELAEAGLCDAAKDISMAGVLGTVLMLLECSKVGARIDLGLLAVAGRRAGLARRKRIRSHRSTALALCFSEFWLRAERASGVRQPRDRALSRAWHRLRRHRRSCHGQPIEPGAVRPSQRRRRAGRALGLGGRALHHRIAPFGPIPTGRRRPCLKACASHC